MVLEIESTSATWLKHNGQGPMFCPFLTFHDSQILDAHVTLANHLIANTTRSRGLVGVVLRLVFSAKIEKCNRLTRP